jgi:transmembrane 9 superfamily protein 2/4
VINQIPRQVPEQVRYMQPTFSVIVGGVLPFIELFSILSSIWLHQFYYVFGFLLLVFIILVSTCAEITIVMCYFQLCAEDYHWWWRSFLTSGSSAGYMFAYSVFYFFTKLEITKFVSALLYFGYMSIAALVFFVSTGTIGFYLCVCIFVWKSSRRSRSTRRESGAGLERERAWGCVRPRISKAVAD